MKAIFLTLMTCFGITLFASEGTIFRDEDTGFVMTVPADMRRTWNISHSENGMEITVFEPQEYGEKIYVITIGKVPLKSITGEGAEGLFPYMFEQLKTTMQTLQDEDEELPFQIEELPSLANEEYCGQRFRLSLIDDDWDEPIRLDVHSFIVDAYSYIVSTVVSPCFEEELDDFTNMILSGVRFIEEGE